MAVKVLVIDDEPDLELLVRQRFRKKVRDGVYDFVFARNGAEALERLREIRPSVILLDLMMPVMDGQKFREVQLARPEIASIPTLLLTADARATEAARRMSVAGLLAKPIALSHLLDVVRSYCPRA